jgi:galactose mutarotase-like enzyme
MNVSIKNEHLVIDFSTKGAELQSIKGTDSNVNYMWKGDSAFWGKFSPILFPIVGALKENIYYYKDKKFSMSRHGFARDLGFEHHYLSDTEIMFKLVHNQETLNIYPFEFELIIRYELKGASLSCTYEVHNPATEVLLFSIGGHPAFAAPLHNEGIYTDYYLQFNADEELTYNHIIDNLISDQTATISLTNKELPLNHELFYNDALVFKKLKSNNIRLLNKKNYNGIEFSFDGFPYFGIWAAKDADFVCLEPWCGIADGIHHNQQFSAKEGVVHLDGGSTWKRSWKVCCF